MTIDAQIEDYIAAQPAPKSDDLRALHGLILAASPGCQLWFLDGRDASGKIVANPNIGYGVQTMKLACGKTRDFYQIGLSANTTGISIYIIGIADKKYLAETWGKRLGKASVTGYCIKFRALNDVDIAVLEEIVRFGLEPGGEAGRVEGKARGGVRCGDARVLRPFGADRHPTHPDV